MIDIRALRHQLHLTQEQLSARSGIAVRTIRTIENGTNENPSPATLKALYDVLHPTATDYTQQEKLLQQYADRIPTLMIAPINRLIDNNKKNVVSHFFARMSGYLRANTNRKNTRVLMDALAASLATSSLSDSPSEVESFTRALLNDLQVLSQDKIKSDIAEQIILDRTNLASSRFSSDVSARFLAIRAIFFTIYDNWEHFQSHNIVYSIISDISILCNYASDDYTMRQMTFDAAMNYFLA